MAVKKKKNQMQPEKSTPDETNIPAEDFSSELNELHWAVISFENSMAKNLTYAKAEQKLKELEAENVSGLCIVTNEVAEKVSSGSQQ